MNTYDEWLSTEPVDPHDEELRLARWQEAIEEDKRQGQRREIARTYAEGKCQCENCTANFIKRLEAI